MMSAAIRNFMKQQGFADESPMPATCTSQASISSRASLGRSSWPGIILHAAGFIVSAAALFFVLSALLWWNVTFPALNPFEQFYNHVLALPRGKAVLVPAPGPRRFAQAMAAAFTLIAGIAILQGWTLTARIFEVFLVAAFSMLLFGKFCLGAYIYHLLRGEFAFANATLPWAGPPALALNGL